MIRHLSLRPTRFLLFAAAGALLCLPPGAHAQETTVTTTLNQGTWLTIPGSGCKVLDPSTKVPTDVKLTWSGSCVDGLANGEGALNATWDNGNKWIRSEAIFSQGRRNGMWKSESWTGARQVRSYKDGSLHGPSARLMSNGTYGEYFFVNGKRIMSWLVAYSYPDGRWCSGNCRERGVSENFVIVVRAEGKEPLTQACGTDAKACRLKVREIVKETLRQVAERAKQPASSPPAP